MALRVVVLSDTHGRHREIAVPDGDVLIHAGDITRHGELDELAEIDAWLAGLPHRHKLVVAGNHDRCFEQLGDIMGQLLPSATYLQDAAVTIDGVRFYGSPWTPAFFSWAFNLPRGAPLAQKWARIPPGVDVLITHGPPRGQRDATVRGEQAGCADLLRAVQRVRPQYHVFGHIHEAAGRSESGGTVFINASVVDLHDQPVNAPVVFELTGRAAP